MVLGNLPDTRDVRDGRSFTVLRRPDAVLRLDLGVLVGLLVSTEYLTVGTVTVNAGRRAARSRTPARSSSTSREARCGSAPAAWRRRSLPVTDS